MRSPCDLPILTERFTPGLFQDLGQPLLEKLPEGGHGGQQIDPAALQDPETGRYYLCWGNGYLATTTLADNLLIPRPGITHVLTPDAPCREGSYVFYRISRT